MILSLWFYHQFDNRQLSCEYDDDKILGWLVVGHEIGHAILALKFWP